MTADGRPADIGTELAEQWVAAQQDPAAALQRARHEFDLNFGLLGGFHTRRDRFEAAVRADARARFQQDDALDLLDHRRLVLTEAADHLERTADKVEAAVAEHYGPASGIGPGSAAMLRQAAADVRSLATRT